MKKYIIGIVAILASLAASAISAASATSAASAISATSAISAASANSITTTFSSVEESSSEESTIKKPDFAFPQNVLEQADADYAKAVAKRDTRAAINAIVRQGLASTAISPDSIVPFINRLESLRTHEKDVAAASVLALLEATALDAFIDANRFELDSRTAQAGETDLTLMNAQQIKDKIAALATAAIAPKEALLTTPLSDWSDVIVIDKDSAVFYPTLYDFACQTAIDLLDSIGDDANAASIAKQWMEAYPSACAPKVMAAKLYCKNNPETKYMDTDEELLKMYHQLSSTPYAIELILAQNQNIDNTTYPILKKFTEEHPDYYRINAVREVIANILHPIVNIKCNQIIAKNHKYNLDLDIDNVTTLSVKIYYGGSDNPRKCALSDLGECIEEIPVDLGDITLPYDNKKLTVGFTPKKFGIYTFTTVIDSVEVMPHFYRPVIHCSDLTLITINGNTPEIYCVNPLTGAPVKGARLVMDYTNTPDGDNSFSEIISDSKGRFDISDIKIDRNQSLKVHPIKGDDQYSLPVYTSSFTPYSNNLDKKIWGTVTTKYALPVYHPGDTLRAVAVVTGTTNRSGFAPYIPLTNKKIQIELRDPNNQSIDTLECTTDKWGRAEIAFSLPVSGITGDYQLCFKSLDDEFTLTSTSSITVSDFKLPTLLINLDKIKQTGENYVITGEVMSYSGFPIQGADVTIDVSLSEYYFRYRHNASDSIMIQKVKTDSKGRYSLSFPVDIIKKALSADAYQNNGYINVEASAVAASGELQSAHTSFLVSTKYTINIQQNIIVDASSSGSLPIYVRDNAGDVIDAEIALQLTSLTDSLKTFTLSAYSKGSLPKFDFDKIPSGSYSVIASSPLYNAQNFSTITVYRPTDKESPSPNTLWVPKNSYETLIGETCEIVFATAKNPLYILCTIAEGDSIISQNWMKPSRGMHKMKLPASTNGKTRVINLIGIYNYESYNQTISVISKDPAQQINVEVENLRDYVTPTAKESMTLKITDGNGSPQSAALILDIYSSSINAISQARNSINLYNNFQPYLSFGYNLNIHKMYYVFEGKLASVPSYPDIVSPEFEFYGMRFGNSAYTLMAQPLYATGAVKNSGTASVSSTNFDEINFKSMETEDEIVEEESAVLNNESDAVTPDEKTMEPDYRDVSQPLALFEPMLETDDEGRVTASFTWPNVNTTWVVNAIAYNEHLRTAFCAPEIIASKPVMVSANPPRFLRQGDEVKIRATAMNATKETQPVTVKFSLLNPLTFKEIAQPEEYTDTLAASGSHTYSYSIAVNPDWDGTLLRVSVTTGNYTDAEQHLIPILNASQPVVESDVFYLSPSSGDFTHTLPDRTDASTTLSFTANPIWEVVTALPGLRESSMATALSASSTLYSAAIGKGIITDNPTIASRLADYLADHADDKESLSKLARNEELKQLVLNSTPWMQAAQGEATQISRLALLLDSGNADALIAKSVEELEKWQNTDGGFRWCGYSQESSAWVTHTILYNLASLKSLGYLPEEIEDMAEDAMAYLDSKLCESIERDPNAYDITFLSLCQQLSHYTPSEKAAKANERALAAVKSAWKGASPGNKADYASILYRADDIATAKSILRSLNQFSTYRPEKGRFWDALSYGTSYSTTPLITTSKILRAYTLIDPKAAEVDQIRQWLVYNKFAQGWGDSAAASKVVESILSSGTRWTDLSSSVSITVDDKPLNVNIADTLSGALTAQIPAGSGTLNIDRTAEVPAWGAIISRYTAGMSEVKAESCTDLSIEKQYLVERNGNWVEATDFTVGDVVKTRVIIRAGRRIDYVTIVDNRAATMEPVIQTPRYIYSGSVGFYLENRDSATNLFIDVLPKGTYILEYEMKVNNDGSFASGLATIQSQYTPEYAAHSAGTIVTVE